MDRDARRARQVRRVRPESQRSEFDLPNTSNPRIALLLDLAGGIRLIRQSIQDRFKLQACLLQCLFIGVSRDPDGGTPQIEASGPWVRDHESIPAREEFFFEQLNASGTIGSPVAFANWITPSFATCRGPLGPSGVTTRSAPERPRRINSRRANAPPLVLDPRTAQCPNREMMRAIISPS